MIESTLSNLPSIFLYLSVFSLSAYFIYISNLRFSPKSWQGLVLTSFGLMLPVLISGLRYNVGRDYSNYVGMMDRVQIGQNMWPRPIEPLSSLVINISAFFDSSVVMFTSFSLITVVFAYLAVRRLSPSGFIYLALSWATYLLITFPTTLNAVRSGVAVSLIIFAFSYLIDFKKGHRLIWFFVWALVACLFHISALIYIPIGVFVYAYSYHDKSNTALGAALFGGSVLVALATPLLGGIIANAPIDYISNLSRYFREIGVHFYITITSIIFLSVVLYSVFVNKKYIQGDRKLNMLYYISIYLFPVSIMVGWLSYYTGTSRIAFFVEPIVMVLLVYAVKNSKGNSFRGYPIVLPTIIVFIIFNFAMLVRNLNWSHALPYRTILSQEASGAN